MRPVPLRAHGRGAGCHRAGRRLPDRPGPARTAESRRHYLSRRRQRLPRTVPHLAAPRVGDRPAGDQRIDSPPRHRRARRSSIVILLFAGWFLQTGYREPGKLFFSVVLTATTYLVLLIALLGQRVQPAERFQIENDLHGRHQAGAGRRHRARPHPRLHDRRHACCWRSWRFCSYVLRRGECSTTRMRSKIDTLQNIYDAKRQGRRQERPHDAPTSSIARGGDCTRWHRHWRSRPTSTSTRSRAPNRAAKPSTTSAARTACCVPACRTTARSDFSIARASRCQGHQRRQRMDLSQLHRRRHARWPPSGRSAASTRSSLRKDDNGAEVSADGVDRPRLPHVQGRHRKRHPRHHPASQSGSNRGKYVKSEPWTFTAKDGSINTFDWSRQAGRRRPASRSTC